MKISLKMISVLFIFAVFLSCKSMPTEVDQAWSEENFFIAAQEASDLSNYKAALFYYEVFLVRYPENHTKGIAAEYERAFIYYKLNKYKKAESLFNDIIDKYETSPNAMYYEERYRILTNIVLDRINEKKIKKKDSKSGEAIPDEPAEG